LGKAAGKGADKTVPRAAATYVSLTVDQRARFNASTVMS
jgi:hypothetical protein